MTIRLTQQAARRSVFRLKQGQVQKQHAGASRDLHLSLFHRAGAALVAENIKVTVEGFVVVSIAPIAILSPSRETDQPNVSNSRPPDMLLTGPMRHVLYS